MQNTKCKTIGLTLPCSLRWQRKRDATVERTMIATRRKICFLTLFAALACGARAEELYRFEFSQPKMGTVFSIILFAADADNARKTALAAFDRIEQLNGIMSDYKPDSELNLLCKNGVGAPVKISDDLFNVLGRAQDIARQSDGAFDVTVGPLVRLWRKSRKERKLPDAEELAKANELVGFEKLQLDANARTAQLKTDGMQLDLGGLAKGYAADQALAVIKANGIKSALVAAGGDIAVSDAPPGKNGWTVAVAPLMDEPSEARALANKAEKKPKIFLSLTNAGVSTSGDTEQFVEIGGKRYSHIVNPKTGLGFTVHCTVTVVAKNTAITDAVDTAVYALGPEKGLKLVESTEGAAALIVQAVDGGEKTFESSRWKDIPRATK